MPLQEAKERYVRAQEAAEACIKHLKEQFHVKEVHSCGSLAQEGPFHPRSDIDLVVEGLVPGDYFEALRDLWELLPPDLELDLIRLENAPPGLIRRVRGEAKMPVVPKEALKVEIDDQLQILCQVVEDAREYLTGTPVEPGHLEIAGVGKLVHDFYNGIERIFERVAVRIDEDVPPGSHWHVDLLRRMERPWGQKRPAVISHSLALGLFKLLRFRHLFRHTYGFELLWEEIKPLAEGLTGLLDELNRELPRFLAKP